jgi:lysyl-tRNA synthetase, class II
MADADKSLADGAANLHLDEVTGERVSKSELKKRQKQRQAEEKKKEKAAAAGPLKTEKKAISGEMAESDLTPNVRQSILICRQSVLISALAIP